MIRCGSCMKSYGILLPVIATSRGLVSDSYAHQDCIAKWQLTADVVVDPTRKIVDRPFRKRVGHRKSKTSPASTTPSYAVNAWAWQVASAKHYGSHRTHPYRI